MNYDTISGQGEIIDLPLIGWTDKNQGGVQWDDAETVIGTRNGKPLYQRIFNFKPVSGNQTWKQSINITSLNIKELVHLSAYMHWTTSPYYDIPLGFGSNVYIAVTTSGNNKYLTTWIYNATYVNYPITARIVYTKTTD